MILACKVVCKDVNMDVGEEMFSSVLGGTLDLLKVLELITFSLSFIDLFGIYFDKHGTLFSLMQFSWMLIVIVSSYFLKFAMDA